MRFGVEVLKEMFVKIKDLRKTNGNKLLNLAQMCFDDAKLGYYFEY